MPLPAPAPIEIDQIKSYQEVRIITYGRARRRLLRSSQWLAANDGLPLKSAMQ
jgi:hypothetical protein